METIKVETTQNVSLEYAPASIGERILAFLIDILVEIAYIIAVIQVIDALELKLNFRSDSLGVIILYFFLFIPIIFYDILSEIFLNGQSIGKKAMNIKVIRTNGRQADIGQYALRWFFRVIDVKFSAGLVAIIGISANGRGQRLGDLAADTCVIRVPKTPNMNLQLLMPQFGELYSPKYMQVTLLSDNDINLIKEFLIAYRKERKSEILEKIAQKTKLLLGLKYVEEFDNQVFLNVIVKDYSYLTSAEE